MSEDLKRIRQTGISIDNEERTLGMRCIAAPIFNSFGEPIAGISVSGPTSRMDDIAVTQFSDLVGAAAAEVTEAVGGFAP